MTIKPYSTGSGIMLNDFRFTPAVAERIEALGKLNDRRLLCVANRDIEGVRKVAAEYSVLNMVRMANSIYKEISVLTDHATHGRAGGGAAAATQ